MPGDHFLYLSSDQGQEVRYTEEQRQYYLEYYGLNRPAYKQYLSYLASLVRGDLGMSLHYNQSVLSLILHRLRWTIFLTLSAVVFSTVIGVFLGLLSAWYRENWIDKILFFNLVIISEIPPFLSGLVLLFVFAASFKLIAPKVNEWENCSPQNCIFNLLGNLQSQPQ